MDKIVRFLFIYFLGTFQTMNMFVYYSIFGQFRLLSALRNVAIYVILGQLLQTLMVRLAKTIKHTTISE